jgi:hypothetical protein
MPSPCLKGTPVEILHEIALATVRASPIGPPTDLYALLLTCWHLNDSLSAKQNPGLYANVLDKQFDCDVLYRHFGQLTPECASAELRRRFNALKCIRRGRVHDPELPEALFTAFLLLVENVRLNSAQLRWADLHGVVHTYLRERLFVGSESNNGWPLENETNSLVIYIAWLMSSRGGSFPTINFPSSYTV